MTAGPVLQENPDENLLVAVGDALPALAAALGPDAYAPIFAQQHAEALFKWLRGSQPDSVRAAGTGVAPAWNRAWPCAEFSGSKDATPMEDAYVLPSLHRRGHQSVLGRPDLICSFGGFRRTVMMS